MSYFSDAASERKTYEQAQAAKRPGLQMFALLFLVVLAIKTARDKDASWWRVPGDMLVVDDWDAEREVRDRRILYRIREDGATVVIDAVRHRARSTKRR